MRLEDIAINYILSNKDIERLEHYYGMDIEIDVSYNIMRIYSESNDLSFEDNRILSKILRPILLRV